jgi:hypothetical protein
MTTPADFLPSRGQAASLLMIVERELSADDLMRLAATPPRADYVPAVKRLSQRHHRQAQLIAEGYKLREVAAIVGSTPERLTQLQRDPSFMELVAFYGDQRMTVALETGARVRGNLEETLVATSEEIRRRTTDPEQVKHMPISELRQIATFAADRTVAPPKVSQPIAAAPTSITLSFGRELEPQVPKDVTPAPALTIEHKD